MKKTLLLITLSAMIAAPAASALTRAEIRQCNALAEAFKPKQVRFEARTAERDALALIAEETGEAWQNAENLRTISADAAAKADEARRVYDAAVTDFDASEFALSELGIRLNSDIAAFNRKCTKK